MVHIKCIYEDVVSWLIAPSDILLPYYKFRISTSRIAHRLMYAARASLQIENKKLIRMKSPN